MNTWRTLVCVEDSNEENVFVNVPAYDPRMTFGIPMKKLPGFIREAVRSGQRFLHAKCDLGVEEGADLVFVEWEAE